jgi:hypothetical protein
MATKIIHRILKIYDDCNNCPEFQKPDENREMLVMADTPGEMYTIKLTKEIITKDGTRPNPICGRCRRLRILVEDTKLPVKRYDFMGVCHPCECNEEHFVNEVAKEKIQKGDKIVCYGTGYPHWKGMEFECTLDFGDGTIGILNGVRVSENDFEKQIL